jgi:hypothetical protein
VPWRPTPPPAAGRRGRSAATHTPWSLCGVVVVFLVMRASIPAVPLLTCTKIALSSVYRHQHNACTITSRPVNIKALIRSWGQAGVLGQQHWRVCRHMSHVGLNRTECSRLSLLLGTHVDYASRFVADACRYRTSFSHTSSSKERLLRLCHPHFALSLETTLFRDFYYDFCIRVNSG